MKSSHRKSDLARKGVAPREDESGLTRRAVLAGVGAAALGMVPDLESAGRASAGTKAVGSVSPASALIVLGGVFAGLLSYVKVRRVPGGCGCNGWHRRPEPVTWRSVARAGLIGGAGIAELALLAHAGSGTARGDATPPGVLLRPWFAAGLLAGVAVLTLASTGLPVRTLVCGRPVLLPARRTLLALSRHAVFTEMAASAGPFGVSVRHRRAGCSDEFWFTSKAGPVAFRVEHAGRAGALAVGASIGGSGQQGAHTPGRPVRSSRLIRRSLGTHLTPAPSPTRK